MLATYLPDLLTPIDASELALALKGAVREVLGRDITADGLAVLLAQSALETGNWRSLHRLGLGNIKASSTYAGHYTSFRCNEIIGGKLQWFSPTTGNFPLPPGHPQTRFRAYLDLAHASLEHVAFLAQRQRYAKAWGAALDGDPSSFVHELKLAGYFTASEAPYLRAVVSLFKSYHDEAEAAIVAPGALDCSAVPCAIDEHTDKNAFSDADLIERLRSITWPDWREALDLQTMADELENDLRDAGVELR